MRGVAERKRGRGEQIPNSPSQKTEIFASPPLKSGGRGRYRARSVNNNLAYDWFSVEHSFCQFISIVAQCQQKEGGILP